MAPLSHNKINHKPRQVELNLTEWGHFTPPKSKTSINFLFCFLWTAVSSGAQFDSNPPVNYNFEITNVQNSIIITMAILITRQPLDEYAPSFKRRIDRVIISGSICFLLLLELFWLRSYK